MTLPANGNSLSLKLIGALVSILLAMVATIWGITANTVSSQGARLSVVEQEQAAQRASNKLLLDYVREIRTDLKSHMNK